jgi:hypothetical protein
MNKSRTYISRCLAGAAGAFACAGPAIALEASDILVYSHGPLSLRPQVGFVEQFNDNVFYSKDDAETDFVTVISPGVKLQFGQDLPTENHINLNYYLEQVLYIDHSSLNATQHKLATDIHFSRTRFTIDGGDRLELLSSVLGGGFSLRGPDARRNIDRTLWWDIYRFDYKIGERTGVYIEGQHVSTDYENDVSLFDTRTLIGTAGFQYRLGEDTFLFGEVYYGQTSLHANQVIAAPAAGTSFVGGFVGARGHFTEKLNGTLKAGYEVSSFSNTGPGVDNSAGNSPVVEAAITYLATERLSTTLSYSRRQQVSVQYVRSSFVSDTVTATASQVLGSTGRLRLDLTALYAMYSYDPAPAYPTGRSDSSWKVQTGASYFFQTWLSTRLEYSFERFTSDFADIVDYDVNRVTLSLAIGY